MFLWVISGLLLLIAPAPSQAQWTKICEDLCEQLPYEGTAEECVGTCEVLFNAQADEKLPDHYYYNNELDGAYDDEMDVNKRSGKSAFVRIGRNAMPRKLRMLKSRKSGFVRIGRSVDDQEESASFQEEAPAKRASSFLRIGRDLLYRLYNKDDNFKRTSNFVRIGKKSTEDAMNKRASAFVRIGRPSQFVRIGKSVPAISDEEEKRASGFVRIGRPSGFVRIGKSAFDEEPENKRSSSFVRIGKSSSDFEDSDAKRTSAFVRIGKSNDGESDIYTNKRPSGFVRIGKSMDGDGKREPLTESDKRSSSFVRIGKSPDRSENSISDLVDDVMPLEGGQKRTSSFVRIGKRDAE